MFWVALAAQLSAPVPINFFDWWRDEMPLSVYNAGVTRMVIVRTTVRPDGSIQGCDVERGSGNAELDAVTCVIIRKKGKFHPARAADGLAEFGVFRDAIKWVPHIDDPLLMEADLEVNLDRLPRGLKAPVPVRVSFAVDEQGHPSSCVGQTRSGASDPAQQLAGAACDQLTKSYTAIPARDDSGRAVPSIQEATVVFLKGKGV